jgi:DNA-binding XRE family transcriptional regulator
MPVLKQLKAVREGKAFLTQKELAERAGVHVQTVARLEAGANAELKTARVLAKALGVEPQVLISSE